MRKEDIAHNVPEVGKEYPSRTEKEDVIHRVPEFGK
jgi:hypothetical protein